MPGHTTDKQNMPQNQDGHSTQPTQKDDMKGQAKDKSTCQQNSQQKKIKSIHNKTNNADSIANRIKKHKRKLNAKIGRLFDPDFTNAQLSLTALYKKISSMHQYQTYDGKTEELEPEHTMAYDAQFRDITQPSYEEALYGEH